jgi:hypothetical protein
MPSLVRYPISLGVKEALDLLGGTITDAVFPPNRKAAVR